MTKSEFGNSIQVYELCACGKEPLTPVGENPVLNAAGTDTLTVMTYNVKNCGAGEKIADVAADIRAEDPDVVCLQEVDRNVKRSGERDELQALANELGMNYVFFPAIRLQGDTYGVGILSVYPLTDCEMVPLETRREDEDRVLASAAIRVNGQTIMIYNTHLSFEDTDQRQKQWAFLQQTLQQETNPFVLTRDFNITDIAEFSNLTGVTAVNNAQTRYETYLGDGSGGGMLCIDNIFVSDKLTVANHRLANTTVSDHRPLVAEIQL